MNKLTEEQALKVRAIILEYGDDALVGAYEEALERLANAKKGLHSIGSNWNGTPISEKVVQALRDKFSDDVLETFKYRSGREVPGMGIRLVSEDLSLLCMEVLVKALPEHLVTPHGHHSFAEKAREFGIDTDRFLNDLKSGYKGTVGRPGRQDFGILLDIDFILTPGTVELLGAGYFASPNQTRDDGLGEDVRLTEEQQVIAKGLDPATVVVLKPEHNPAAAAFIAQHTNFPGASHYMPMQRHA